MNLAWKLTEALSENFTRRNKILEKFKTIELIPDGLFIDPSSTRNKAVINLFAKNFPELLSYYGKNCVNFLKGKENTAVTSSLNCQKFLKVADEIKSNDHIIWVNDSISTEYSAIKK